jgi:hypothetical protein
VTTEEPKPRPSLLRRIAPWAIGAVIVAIIVSRVPYAAFKEAMQHGPHLALALTNLAINLAVLATDSTSTWVGLIGAKVRRPFVDVLIVRGATFALHLLNYAVGQGGFGYYLHRTGVPALRAAGVTLFLIGTNLATLLVVTSIAWTAYGGGGSATLAWTLVIGCVGYVLYLVIIVASPGMLVRRELLAPLFDAGLKGHALAMLGRLPHVIVLVIGQWAAIRVWGIDVPFVAGMTIMPAVVIASVLPISPAGLGTTQAAFTFFFADYAVGATADDRAATVLAFSIVHFVYGVAASLAVGLACIPFARKTARPSA